LCIKNQKIKFFYFVSLLNESPSPSLAKRERLLLRTSFATKGNPAELDKGGEVLSEV